MLDFVDKKGALVKKRGWGKGGVLTPLHTRIWVAAEFLNDVLAISGIRPSKQMECFLPGLSQNLVKDVLIILLLFTNVLFISV